MRTLLIDNYDSFTFNLYQLIGEVNGQPPIVVRNDTASWSEIENLYFDNIVISPGPGRPERKSDFGVCAEVIKYCEVPLLGVCLGFQGVCQVFGARINYAPECMHGRVSKINHSGIDIFQNIPSPFEAVRYHSLIVEGIPDELEVISWTDDDIIMGIRHRYRNQWGVQFHPESICSNYGHLLIENFNSLTKTYLDKHPQNRRKNADNFDVVSKLGSIPEPFHENINGPTIDGKKLNIKTRRILLEEIDSESIFLSLYANSPTAFWLDTSLETPFSRYSFMGDASGPFSELLTYDVSSKKISVSKQGKHTEYHETLFDYLNHQLKERCTKTNDLPFDFNLGYVGYLGYELKADCFGNLAHQSEQPDATLLFCDRLIAIDHFDNVVYLIGLSEDEKEPDCFNWMDHTEARIRSITPKTIKKTAFTDKDIRYEMRHSKQEYLALIAKCQQKIHEGESYEICLTNEVTYDEQIDPLETYIYLRNINPAPYSSFLRFPNLSVLCSSPERFLKIDSNGFAESKPIKGTRPRGETKEKDERLYQDLLVNEKDRAENLMIVDLVRNDFSTACDLKSIFVSKIFSVESYATVHQLVSTVRGRLRPDVSAIDCIKYTFPGGTMTGAPKKRTMEIIDSLEAGPRGVYSGSIGYMALNGGVDLNIVIRTLVCANDKITQGIGGAIIALSNPLDEFEETLVKAKAQQQAVSGMALSAKQKAC
jgi:para-aminobenzoate synthetase